ncbi:toll/interleukin-1 receptor domain-containing protein [Goodfellowiella coeruleoviolacea]|nr:toll/interleukin-1 receptor domain-containing protein [Goodfellowiella coeruleoviolacea]
MLVFINFQNTDDPMTAVLLDERLSAEFGREQVTRSSRSIGLGAYFDDTLDDAVQNCLVMLAVIGPRWDTNALQEPGNWVRREIAQALRNKQTRVIPILVGEARLPPVESLPEDMADLLRCQSFRLRSRDAHYALDALVDLLREVEPEFSIGRVAGLQDAAMWWRTYSERSALPAALPLAGRDQAVAQVKTWLAESASVRTLRGPSREDVAAFVTALAVHELKTRAVYVTSLNGWNQALKLRPLLIAVSCDDIDAQVGVRAGHHVLVVRGLLDDDRHVDISLPRLRRDQVRDLFMAEGMALDQANAKAGVARRSLRALARRSAPGWSAPQVPDFAAPLMLVVAWTASDCDHLARLVGMPYEQVERFANGEIGVDDPLVHRSGNRWQLTDPLDAWALLHDRLTEPDLERWRETVCEVFADDTASRDLRKGIARGLAIAGTDGHPMVKRIVIDMLRQAESAERWIRLADVLPQLAEAAPTVFLDAVLHHLSGESGVFRAMFAEGMPHSPYVHLLWALERLCWHPDHIGLSVRALACLAEIDPGGRLMNRPIQSLKDVLTPWMPYTAANLEHRRALVDQLCRRHPEVGWRLVVELLSNDRGLHVVTDRPEYREWETPVLQASGNDWVDAIDHLVDRALGELSRAPARWLDIVRQIKHLPPLQRDRLMTGLAEVDTSRLTEQQALELWWAVSEFGLAPDAVAALEPVGLPQRHAPLFRKTRRDELKTEERIAVVADVLAAHGVSGLARLALYSPSPRLVGSVTAEVSGLELFEDIRPLLGLETAEGELAAGWLEQIAKARGEEVLAYAEKQLESWEPRVQAGFLIEMTCTGRVLDVVGSAPSEAQELFWRRVPPVPSPGEEERLFRGLLDNGQCLRMLPALELALHREGWRPPADLVEYALKRAALRPKALPVGLHCTVGELLDFLTVKAESSAPYLELAFRGVLDRKPRALNALISTYPTAFVDLVKLAKQSTDKQFRHEAWAVLFHCRNVPGELWIAEVRRLLAEHNLSGFGEVVIGQMLSGSPMGQDGAWPAEHVRDLLDGCSAYMAQGFVAGAVNNRGLSVRDQFSGGEQERVLAGQYDRWAEQLNIQWPFVARLLRDCADSFRDDAAYWDRDAEDEHDN